MDLRLPVRGSARVPGLAPQSIADAGRRATGTTRALRGARLAGHHGLETLAAGAGVDRAASLETRIHHDPHAVDGEGGFREARGQDDPPARRHGRCGGAVLLDGSDAAVQHVHLDSVGESRFQQPGATHDLRHTRQEHQNIADVPIQRVQHRALHVYVERGRRFACPQDIDRVLPNGALEMSHLPKPRRQGRGVQRGRHQQQPQITAQGLLYLERQRQSDIRVQAALVELVEDDQRDTGELGIVLDDPCQHPFGDDGQAGVFGYPRLAPHAQPDAPPRLLAEVGGEAGGYRSRRQAAGFEQDDLPGERLAQQQCQGQTRALSGTGLGAQQHVPPRQGLGDVVRERHDGQGGDGIGKSVDGALSGGVPRGIVRPVRCTGCSVSSCLARLGGGPGIERSSSAHDTDHRVRRIDGPVSGGAENVAARTAGGATTVS